MQRVLQLMNFSTLTPVETLKKEFAADGNYKMVTYNKGFAERKKLLGTSK